MIIREHIRAIIMAGVLIVAIVVLSIFNYLSLRSATDIEAVDQLSGQRLACCSGWESDYLLTPRDDITLLRYDTNADCILALAYNQVDAMALDEITANTFMSKMTGLEQLPDPITRIGCTFYASYEAEDKLAEFNEYAAEFIESDRYDAFHDALFEDEFVMPEIPVNETGKILRCGYSPEGYPESYYDFETEAPAGYGVEFLEMFAYDCGYQIEWTEISESSGFLLLTSGQLDFIACNISDVYKDEAENTGVVHMTDAYCFANVYLLKVKEGESLVLTGEVEN